MKTLLWNLDVESGDLTDQVRERIANQILMGQMAGEVNQENNEITDSEKESKLEKCICQCGNEHYIDPEEEDLNTVF